MGQPKEAVASVAAASLRLGASMTVPDKDPLGPGAPKGRTQSGEAAEIYIQAFAESLSAPKASGTSDSPAQSKLGPTESAQSLVDPGPVRFGFSARARGQRKILAMLLAVLMVAGLALLFSIPCLLPAWARLRWLPAAALGWALWKLIRIAFLKPLDVREVLLLPRALELRHGGFRRLVVFENVRHLHITQSPDGTLRSLRLDLEDDSVTLRDVEGLARIFAEVAQRRPPGALIEVVEVRVDWGEPLPWITLVLVLALAALATLARPF